MVPCNKKIQTDNSKLLHVIFNMLKASTAFGSFKAMMSHGTIHNNDFIAQQSVCSIVATLFRIVTTLFHLVALKTIVANLLV